MGSDYALFRGSSAFEGRLQDAPSRSLPADAASEPDDVGLPFGPMEAVRARITPLARGGYANEGPSPPAFHFRLEKDGRSTGGLLLGDPVTSIHVDHAAPWDLLPLAELFADVGPLVVFDPQEGVYRHLATLLPPRAHPCEAPVTPASLRVEGALEPLWGVAAHDPCGFHRGSVLASDDHVWLVAADGVTCFESASGAVRWSVACGRGHAFGARGLERIVVGSDHPELTGLDAATGEVRFTVPMAGRVCHTPRLTPSGFVVGTEGGALVMVDPEGAVAWRRSLGGAIYTPPVLFGEGRLVVATNDGMMRVVDLATGEVEVERELSAVQVNAKTWSKASVFGLVATERTVYARLSGSLARFDGDLVETAHLEVARGGDFDALALVGRRLFSSSSRRDEATGRFWTAVQALDLALEGIEDFEGEGDLGRPAAFDDGLVFVDATGRKVLVDVLDAEGETLHHAELAVETTAVPKVETAGGRIYVLTPNLLATLVLL